MSAKRQRLKRRLENAQHALAASERGRQSMKRLAAEHRERADIAEKAFAAIGGTTLRRDHYTDLVRFEFTTDPMSWIQAGRSDDGARDLADYIAYRLVRAIKKGMPK